MTHVTCRLTPKNRYFIHQCMDMFSVLCFTWVVIASLLLLLLLFVKNGRLDVVLYDWSSCWSRLPAILLMMMTTMMLPWQQTHLPCLTLIIWCLCVSRPSVMRYTRWMRSLCVFVSVYLPLFLFLLLLIFWRVMQRPAVSVRNGENAETKIGWPCA